MYFQLTIWYITNTFYMFCVLCLCTICSYCKTVFTEEIFQEFIYTFLMILFPFPEK